MNYSANTTKVLESFTKKLTNKGVRQYEAIIGIENNCAAITDGFSMLYFKSEELPMEKISLDSFLRPSQVRFPSYLQIIGKADRDLEDNLITKVSVKDIESLSKGWKSPRNQQAFVQYHDGVLSLRLGVPGERDEGLFFNPERISVYSKAIPKDYSLSNAYFINGEDQLILTYSHKNLKNAPVLKLIVCLISKN